MGLAGMKIAVLLRGISYTEPNNKELVEPCTGKSYNSLKVDFFSGPSASFVEYLYEPLIKAGHELTLYLSTYDSKKLSKIIEFLETTCGSKIKVVLMDPKTTTSQMQTVKAGLQLIEPCDYVISTRPDIIYKKPVTDINMNFDSLFFLFRDKYWDKWKIVGDVFFGFPYKWNQIMMDACDDVIEGRNLAVQGSFHFIAVAFTQRLAEVYGEEMAAKQAWYFATDTIYSSAGPNPFIQLQRDKG